MCEGRAMSARGRSHEHAQAIAAGPYAGIVPGRCTRRSVLSRVGAGQAAQISRGAQRTPRLLRDVEPDGSCVGRYVDMSSGRRCDAIFGTYVAIGHA